VTVSAPLAVATVRPDAARSRTPTAEAVTVYVPAALSRAEPARVAPLNEARPVPISTRIGCAGLTSPSAVPW
jgi:hypothetical protein